MNGRTSFVQRAARLLAALSHGPLPQAELAKVGRYRTENAEYAARMLRHDITLLRDLGFRIERRNTRPPVYTLNGWQAPADNDNESGAYRARPSAQQGKE